jgi:hypothetical protein
MKITDCAPAFQKRIHNLAQLTALSADDIYAAWRSYSAACFDQSALVFEFIQWNPIFKNHDRAALIRSDQNLPLA